MAIKIGLDAGHGGKGYTGTYSIDTEKDGLWEKDHALDLTLLIDKALRRNGFETYLTRTGDYRPGDTSQRAISCAKAGCAFALSVHFNGFNKESANGCEVFVPYAEKYADIEVGFREVLTKYFKERKPFARSNSVQSEVFDKKMNSSTREFDSVSSKRDHFGFIRSGWQYGMSADLIEICFLTNRKDFDTYCKNKEEIAEGLAKAIVEGFGKTFAEKKEPIVLPEIPKKPVVPEVPKQEKPIRKPGSGRLNKNRIDLKK